MPLLKRKQRTLVHEVVCEGVGLFEGKPVRMVVKPAPENHGVLFVRTDLPGNPTVRVCIENVLKDFRRTSFDSGTCRVSTVEHLLAALAGLNLDNVLVELSGLEPPVGDGSALPLVEALREAGFAEQSADREFITLDEPLRVESEEGEGSEAFIEVRPGRADDLSAGGYGLTVSYCLSYPKGRLPTQTVTFEITPEIFAKEIAPARSFLLEEEVEYFTSRGLGKGATRENTLVIGPEGLTGDRERFPDEPARHKVLDLLGDLFVLNADLVGEVVASRSGHSLNLTLTKELRKRMEGKQTKSTEPVMDIRQISEVLPHRYPFLLVDRVTELEPGKRAVGYKNVTANEHFFQGHFPGKPVMPGVLQIEAMAQLAGVVMLKHIKSEGKLAVLMSMDGVKFRRQVVPGDRLVLEANVIKLKTRTGSVHCKASVDGKIAAEAKIRFVMVDLDERKDESSES